MIPELLLEEILLGEKNVQDYYKDYNKNELDKALEDLKKSNEEIIEKYPFEKMILNRTIEDTKTVNYQSAKINNSTTNVKHKKFFYFKYISFAVAAALAVFLTVPQVMKSKQVPIEEQVRVKGKLTESGYLRLYKMNDNKIVELKNGEQAQAGDLIQLAYVPGKNKYGFIFSVDGNGNITRHFPEYSWNAVELESSQADVPLTFSYELDDAPDFEYFVFVTSTNSFNLQEVSKFGKKDCNLKYLQKGSFLPKNCKETIFILNK